MLRSAAHAGASIADARTNANAAVLAHSDFFIPSLNRTLPALARTDTRAPNGLALQEQIRAPPTGVHQLAGFKSRFPESVAPTPQPSHSRRFFSQSSKYLRAIARSLSLAWASAFVYMSVIQASSGLAASLATMSQNNPSAAWRDTSSPLNSMLPSRACAR